MIPQRIIQAAIKEAEKSEHKQHKLGAVIFKNNKIISTGYNYPSRHFRNIHPKFLKFKGSIHAEVAAVIDAKTDLKGYSLLVVRVNKSGNLVLAKPCLHCQMYLNYVKLKNIYYSDNNKIERLL